MQTGKIINITIGTLVPLEVINISDPRLAEAIQHMDDAEADLRREHEKALARTENNRDLAYRQMREAIDVVNEMINSKLNSNQ